MDRKEKMKFIILCMLFVVLALIQLYPLIYLLDFSLLKTTDFYVSGLFKLPAPPQWMNYIGAWTKGKIPLFFFNSVIVCVASITITLLLVLMMSYAFVKMEWKGRMVLYTIMLLGMMIPPQTTIISNYGLYEKLGIRESYLSMIIPYVAFNVPFGIFLMSGFLKGISKSLIEAAQIDGCGTFKIIFRVVGPLTKPALSSIGITTFLFCWNEYIMAATFLSTDRFKTLPLSIMKFTSEHGSDLATQFAVMSIVAIPAIVVYFIFSEKITEGIMAGAVKE